MIRRVLLSFCCVVMAFYARGQCSQISISTDALYSCAPATVKFTLNGLKSSKGIRWDVGKGFVHGNDTLYEFYLNPETIRAKAEITLLNGTKCIVSSSQPVEILGKPKPRFEVSRTKLCNGPDSVSFKNISQNTKSISWVIDGTNYFNSTPDIVHYFKTAGPKDISLVIIDSFGCRGIEEFEHVLDIYNDIELDLAADIRTGCVPKNVQFDSKIIDNGEKLESAQWFIEGAQFPFSNKFVLDSSYFAQSGSFDVLLEVETSKGCIHEFEFIDFFEFGDTTPVKLSVDDSTLCVGQKATVKSLGNLKEGVHWITPSASVKQISNTHLELQYHEAGKFDIGAEYEFNNCKSRVFFSDLIEVKEVKADFSSEDFFHCKTPHIVHFENKSYSSESGKLYYTWNYYSGDQRIARSSKINDSLLFEKLGKWDVELIVQHHNGCSDTLRRQDAIRIDTLDADFEVVPPIACIDQNIVVKNSTLRSSYAAPDTFKWIFYAKDDTNVLARKEGNSVNFQYRDTGLYDIEIIAANEIGCIDTFRKIDAIEIVIPDLGFKVADSIICLGETFEFTGTTTPERANFRHFWTVLHASSRSSGNENEGNSFSFTPPTIGNYKLKYAHQIHLGCRDSIVKPSMLKVNGISGAIELDSSSGCLPFVVSPKAIIDLNKHYGDFSDTLIYRWKASSSNGVEIFNSDSPNPKFIFHERGQFKIQLNIINSVGCIIDLESEDIYAGVRAGIHLPTNKICIGSKIDVLNRTSLKPTHVKWDVFAQGKFDSKKGNDLELTPYQRGDYIIRQIASKKNLCFDTASAVITAVDVKGDFHVADTQLYCAPAYAQFEAKAQDADTFIWDFGDGNVLTTTDIQVANIYQINSGWHQGFDVQMISKSTLGCSDTAFKKDVLKVIGPVPEFKMVNKAGCEPLQVKFINRSRDSHRFLMNYNDASPLDSVFNELHSYVRINQDDIQIFEPSLYAIDSLGCAAVFYPDDSVEVFKTSEVELWSEDSIACFPETLQFEDRSVGKLQRMWFRNGSKIDTNDQITLNFNQGQEEYIKLEIVNEYGCKSSTSTSIETHRAEHIDFDLNGLPCLDNQYKLLARSKENTIVNYEWVIDKVVSHSKNSDLNWTFKKSGSHHVLLRVIDTNTCVSESTMDLYVPNPLDVPDGELEYVSFNEQNNIEVWWNNVTDSNIISNILYDGSNSRLQRGSINKNETYLHKISAPKDASCYNLTYVDRCDQEGKSMNKHCPVILELSSDKDFSVTLNWSAYMGWNVVDFYTVYIVDKKGNLNQIARVTSDILSYTHEWLCNSSYTYVIRASSGDLNSWSNREAITPRYHGITERPSIKVASVDEDSKINVKWEHVQDSSFRTYELDISTLSSDQQMRVVETLLLNDTSFTHSEVDVHSKNYVYHIRPINHCEVSAEAGKCGGNILLKSSYKDHIAILDWSAYSDWKNGVDNYSVQILANGRFEEIAQISGSTTTYADADIHENIKGERYYRVIAKEKDGFQTKSISNTTAVIGPAEMYIPNTFSPNGDGLNDVFKPYARFIDYLSKTGINAYRMTIYNRWGEKLFESNNLNQGWNGSYLEKQVPIGSYMYHFHAMGLEKRIFEIKGQVKVIR